MCKLSCSQQCRRISALDIDVFRGGLRAGVHGAAFRRQGGGQRAPSHHKAGAPFQPSATLAVTPAAPASPQARRAGVRSPPR